MSRLLTTIGGEYVITKSVDGVTFDALLYNDSTDAFAAGDDVADVTTEPSNTNYARQSATYSASKISGDWGFDNDSKLTFDFSDQTSSENIDSYAIIANFTSTEAGDGGATDHVIFTGALSQTRDIGSIDTLEIGAGGAGGTIS